jgi:hypothetical protein
LLIFGVAIGVLVIVAIVLVFTLAGRGSTSLLPEDTPKGIVQRFFLALEAEDYQKAYSYTSFPSDRPKYEEWRDSAISSREERGSESMRVTLGEAVVNGNEATVDVVVDVVSPGVPFENPVRTNHTTFSLKKEETSWKITSPTYVWWLCYT